MKIGFDPLMHPSDKSYATRLAELLARYAPDHEYTCDARRLSECDLYHGIRRLRSAEKGDPKQVVVLFDLNFLRHPAMWPLPERWLRVRAIRTGCLHADCVVTVRAEYKRELTRRLRLDERKIRVLPSLGVLTEHEHGSPFAEEKIRRKYMLPNRFLLMVGTNEPGHHQKTVIDGMIGTGGDFNLVICGRRTAYADQLLAYVRENHLATKVSFVYEPGPADLEAIYGMACGLLYLPDKDVSPLPVVGGLRHGLPMLLSDVPLNRETAGDAALYADPASVDGVARSVRRLLHDDALRQELCARASVQAGHYSAPALAHELEELYAAL